jgi:integrase
MPKKMLTDRALKALRKKPAKSGKRYEIGDKDVSGLLVRVNDQGTVTFALVARFPGSSNPTRRTIGEYGSMTLEEAREEAREWRRLLRQGKDPQVERERKEQAEARRQANTFASVAEDYFVELKRRGLRQAGEIEREIRREFVSRWAARPITDIKKQDVLDVVDAAIKQGALSKAHHLLSYASRLYSWAMERPGYGLEYSPVHGMRPARIIGVKDIRTRVLSDVELAALWHASKEIGYPYGPLVRLLMLTGQRKSEVSDARWCEFDLDKREWCIPAERMKNGAPHTVPLTDAVLKVMQDLQRFNSGDHLFSTTFGKTPVNGFSKGKTRLDKVLARQLGHVPPPWVFHDIGRTVRTHMSALPIPDMVRELVIAHTKPGLHKIYDQHRYADEKRHALELWAARLRSIVEPAPANVVSLDRARA